MNTIGSELEAVVFAPLLHCLHNVFNLRILGIFQHLDNFYQALFVLCTCNHHLENAYSSASLTFPELWIRIESLKHIESFHREIELTHLVAIVCDQVEE